jgi:hypothetical protein
MYSSETWMEITPMDASMSIEDILPSEAPTTKGAYERFVTAI